MICEKCKKKEITRMIKKMCTKCYLNEAKNDLIILNDRQKEIIIGLMLGDGCIQFSNKRSNIKPRLTIARSLIDKDYMFWIFNELKCIFNSEPNDYKVFDKRNNKIYYSSRLQSRSLECLLPLREQWYPNKIKIVPKELELTSLILLIWFLDDGTFIVKNQNSYILKLATDGFTKDDTCFLAKMLSKRYNSNFRICKNNNGYQILSSTKGAISFIKEINGIFPNCMKRKKDTWNNVNVNDLHLLKDGQLFNQIKFDYYISKFIIDNDISILRAKDIAKNLNLFEYNNNGLLIPDSRINHFLKKYVKNNLLIDYKMSTPTGGKYKEYHLTENAKQEFNNILIKTTEQIKSFNIDLALKKKI